MLTPPKVLVIGGSDPSSGAGIQADIKAMALFGVHASTVVTCCTAQNTKRFASIRPLTPEDVMEQIDVLLEDQDFSIAKLGLLASPGIIEVLSSRLQTMKVIVDPVLSFTAGGAMPLDMVEAYRNHILPDAWLTTPNLNEARLLTGRKDCGRPLAEAVHKLTSGNVVITGGHGDPYTVDVLLSDSGWSKYRSPRLRREYHGTGCAFASMVAACVSLGQPLEEAVARSKRMLYNRLVRDIEYGKGTGIIDLVSPTEDVVLSVEQAARIFSSNMPLEMVPEVGTNIAYALPHAVSPSDIAGLGGRIVRGQRGPLQAGSAAMGAAKHTARIVLAAMSQDPSIRCAVNIRYSPDTVEKAQSLGMKTASFSREEEPTGSSSMEWGTLMAIETAGSVPEVIWDQGGMGKEPMIRILARSPQDAMRVLERLAPGSAGETVKA